MIKVIGFDLDDTLWAVKPVIIGAEAALKAHLKDRLPHFAYAQQDLLIARKQLLAQDSSLSFRLTALRQAVLTKAMLNSGIKTTQAENLATEAMDVFLEARNRVTFFPGALKALTELAQDYILGALTNGNADIKRLRLDHLFMFSFSAEQVGAAKPDPILFESALAHMEQLTESLNGTVVEQAKSIRRLTQQMDQLADRMAAEDMKAAKDNITKPPHYS